MSKTLSAEVEHKPYFTTKRMALIGVMTAVTCILGPLSIPLPFSPVPISFTNLAIYLAAYVLGMKACTVLQEQAQLPFFHRQLVLEQPLMKNCWSG